MAVTEKELRKRVEHFDVVAKNIYRGGQPDQQALELLKAFGIVKIISFRHEKDWIENDRKKAEALGLEYVSIPWVIWGPYKKEIMDQFFAACADSTEKPVFIHCRRGSERTGVMAALYKIREGTLTKKAAIHYVEQYNIKAIWNPFVRDKLWRYCADMNITGTVPQGQSPYQMLGSPAVQNGQEGQSPDNREKGTNPL